MNADTLGGTLHSHTPRTYTVGQDYTGNWIVVSAPIDNADQTRYEVGPFEHKGSALAEANLLASAAPGNRVES